MKKQSPLELIKQIKKELHGKLEHSAELQVEHLVKKLELEILQDKAECRQRSYSVQLLNIFGLIVRFLPEIKKFFDEQ